MKNYALQLMLNKNKDIMDYCNLILYWNSLDVMSPEFRYAYKLAELLK